MGKLAVTRHILALVVGDRLALRDSDLIQLLSEPRERRFGRGVRHARELYQLRGSLDELASGGLVAGALDLPLVDWDDPLYPLFVARCGVAITRAVDEIAFAPLTAAQARALALPPCHPGVAVTRQAHDLSGRCVELRVTRGNAHALPYSVTIT